MPKNQGFPHKVYGRCPLGHNIQPKSDLSDSDSTNQIDDGEDRPLYWSNYHQKFICLMHLNRVDDIVHEERFHERDLEFTRDRQRLGFENS